MSCPDGNGAGAGQQQLHSQHLIDHINDLQVCQLPDDAVEQQSMVLLHVRSPLQHVSSTILPQRRGGLAFELLRAALLKCNSRGHKQVTPTEEHHA